VAPTSQVKGLTMAQAVSCQHLTMETLANPRPVHVGFVRGKVALGQDFLQVLPFYPARIILIIPSEWQESSLYRYCKDGGSMLC